MGLIYLDSCIVIYAVDMHPVWGERSRAAIMAAGDAKLAISPLVKLECLVRPIARHDSLARARFTEFFKQFETLEMPEAVYLRAADLRARFRLKTPDALHLAAAQHHGCDALWTNDGRLDRASHGLARNVVATR